MQQRQQTGGRTKAIAFLLVSILAAAGAAALVLKVISSANEQLAEARAQDNKVDVVVATRELFVGLPITDMDVAVKSFPPEIVPADVVFTSVENVVGRTPKERILPNEFVRNERLALADVGRGLNAIIDSGTRAMSIFVNTESSVAGFIEPGNFVDVIVTIRPDDTAQKSWTTETLLQNVKVLAVGDSLTRPRSASENTGGKKKRGSGTARAKPTVTLEVTPEEAQKLALATAKGDVHLALRSNIDSVVLPTKRVTAKDIIGYEPVEVATVTTRAARRTKPQKQPEQEDAGGFVDVISGGERTQVNLDAEGNVKSDTNRRRGGR